MVENYCLPPKLVGAFLSKLRDGTISPEKLTGMTSGERRKLFAEFLGDEHAQEVNAALESKLILKDQQRGMINWAKQVAGLSETRRAGLIDKINRMEKVLSPGEQKEFLADLAAQKLGVAVTEDEAKQILNLSKVAQEKRDAAQVNPGPETWTAYGLSKMDLDDLLNALKPKSKSWSEVLVDAANAPKTLETGFLHFSAPFVQLWGMISTGRAWEGIAQMGSYFADESNYRNLIGYIVGHPDYPVAVRAGLSITRLGEKLSAREEAFQSSMIERLNEYAKEKTGVPNVFRASGRAFTGTLNYVRFNRFTDLLEAARLNGEDVSAGSKASKDLAAVVNDFTGRGSLKTFGLNDSNQAALNLLFFAPRKIAATVQMFNPVRYLDPNISATARQAAFRQMTGSLMATGVVLNLAKMAGFKVDFDPRSQDFLKPQIGGVKFDLTGGSAIWARLLARLVSNQEVTSRGKLIELGQGFKPKTRADLILDYTRGKLAPTAAAFADWLYGRDQVGRPFSVSQELKERLTPIVMNNFIEFFQSNADHSVALLPVLAGIFGVGVESPLPPQGKYKYTVWGQDNSKPWEDRPADPVTDAYARLGKSPGYPPEKLRGVKLTPEQYEEYQKSYGQLTYRAISHVVTMPGFQKLPASRQEELIRKQHAAAARAATDRFLAHHHELIPKIVEAKRALDRGVAQQ